ncbi:cytochrome b N-terminal domain-containing protein [bacterium]|nr:cytochrome b N-terminal domain-containing protein [bacterium]
MRALLERVADFLESRAGARTMLRLALDEPVPGGARWVYVPGSVLISLLAVQVLTGIVLAFYYSPSVTTAWASIVYLEEKINAGRFVRGLHGWGASAIVLGLAAHYAQVVWFGAYRKPREVNWAIGLVLVLVVLAFALTGYLLPWDQKGFWATKVATGIAGATPVVGGKIQMLAQGGNDYGNLTLTRFYAIHVVLLPALLVSLVAAHVYVFRRHGVTTPPSVPEDAKPARFFPEQFLKDGVAFVLVLAALAAFVRMQGGAPLEAPADAASDYQARPEWYFLPLFELLKHTSGSLEFVGAEVVPAVVFLVLLLLPWIDRAPTRAPHTRAKAILLGLAPIVVAAALGGLAASSDAQNPELVSHRKQDEEDAKLARRLFLENGGVPPEGPLALLDRYPPRLGKRVFVEQCSSCHRIGGKGGTKGPELTGYLSPRWLAGAIRAPQDPKFYGSHDKMGPTEAKPDEIDALVSYIVSLRREGARTDAKAEKGKKVFAEKQCDMCHDVRLDQQSGEGPNLAGYGSDEWLESFLLAPGAQRFHADRNRMPSFKEKLSQEELKAVTMFLRALETSAGE